MSTKPEEVKVTKKEDSDLTPILIETVCKYALESSTPIDVTDDGVYMTWAYLKVVLPKLEKMIQKGIKVDINSFKPKK